MNIPPETLAWLRHSAALDGAVVSQTLLNLLERVEALEAAQPAPPAPEPGEVAKLAADLQSRQFGPGDLDRAATLLQQQAGMVNCHWDGPPPAPHTSVSDWFEEEGSKGILYGLRISPLPSRGGSRQTHAIPLPQAEEVEG